ncbi:MAG: NAD(P)/FAD-dependent oxidoreductase [Treponema sp.]|nr:NAD(P)/FAD-dependent oxidoreductase [Treponema sp.]
MKSLVFDATVIGGGAAGMAAALELESAGFRCAIIEREDHLGGILMQCIHNGFGLHEFSEELTGPEYAGRFIEKVIQSKISVYLNTTVSSICEIPAPGTEQAASEQNAAGQLNATGQPHRKELLCVSPDGVFRVQCGALVLAMGCRERNRGNVRIPGSRPAGVFTAGLAQRLVNIEGYIPGREIVIIGSGDIGLIMARRMSWSGCKVKAVVEIMPYPAGLTRNIVQCLNDFDIPLYLSSQTSAVYGNDRVEGIEVTPLENGVPVNEKHFRIDCDTILLSVGLVPENELSRAAGVLMNGNTNGPLVDSMLMTNVEGVFACGNVLHVHDLVDWVSDESRRAGRSAAAWLGGTRPGAQIRTKPGSNVRYVNPGKIATESNNQIYLRSMIVKNAAVLELRLDNKPVKSYKKGHVQPSEMINLTIGPKDLEGLRYNADSVLEIALL